MRALAIALAVIELPAPRLSGQIPLESTLQKRRSIREFSNEPLPLEQVSQLLWAAQGITSAEGGRTTPSAGALYPLEIYLVAGKVTGLLDGVYRYDPVRNTLEPVETGDLREKLSVAALSQQWVEKAPALLVITADYSKTAAKYGDRAERYAQIEAGHAGQNIYLQATAMGLGTVMVGAFSDHRVAKVLGLPKNEAPLAIYPVGIPR